MSKFNATDLIVTVDGNAIAHATSATLSIDMNTIDTSTKSSAGWAEAIGGQRSWSIDVEGLIDYSATFGSDGMFDAINSRSTVTLVFATTTTGDTKFTGTALVSSLTNDAPLEDVASWSGSFTGTGALTKGTV